MGNDFIADSTHTYYVPPFPMAGMGFSAAKKDPAAEAEAKRKKQEEEESKKAAAEYMKRMEVLQLKAEHAEEIKNLQKQEEIAIKARANLEKSKNSNGEGRIDTGHSGLKRWLGNAWATAKNMCKSFIGYDKDGKWSLGKCLTNIGITAAAIGACFIPYVGPVIAYGLLAVGVVGGGIGIAKGISDLDDAEASGDQAKIDAAQQDIWSNIFMVGTSVCGLKGLGKGFRTSAATAEKASCAAQGTSRAGKVAESLSNFGKDITVNAYRATEYSAARGVTPSLTKMFSGWDKKYNAKLTEYETLLNRQIQSIDELMQTTTDEQALTLLIEKKALLSRNRLELSQFKSLKAKADIDKLVAADAKTAGQSNIERLSSYSADANGDILINGYKVKGDDFAKFQKQMNNLQRAYDRSFRDLIQAKENMMRTYAHTPDKYRTELDEYVSTADVDKHWWNRQTKEELAIGGSNPSSRKHLAYSLFTHPTSNVPKISAAWVDPIHSGASLFTADLSAEDTQAEIANATQAIEGIRNLRLKFDTAKTKAEFDAALSEYKMLVAASNVTAQNTENKTSDSEKKTDENKKA